MDISTILKGVYQKNVSKNIFFLGITQTINYIFPLLTLPFLVKILGDAGFGKVSFAQTFIGYFVLVVDYGFNISATRKIAVFKNDAEQLRKIYYNVIYSKLTLLIISLLCLLPMTFWLAPFNEDSVLYWLFFGMVIGNLLYPQWLFQGLEKMAYITMVNLIVKTIFTVLVFVVIRNREDYWLVGLLTGVSYIIPGICAFMIGRKMVGNAICPNRQAIKSEMVDGFHIFTSNAMAAVLTTFPVFILGLMETEAIVGGYAAMDKLIKAAISVFAPITMAIYPTISKQLALSEKDGIRTIKKYALPTIIFSLSLLAILLCVKNILIANFFTPDFLKYSFVFVILACWIPISVLNNFIGVQYLTGSNRGKLYGQSFLIAGTITLVVMFLLTKFYSYNGTVWAVLFGEVLLTVIMLLQIYVRIKRK